MADEAYGAATRSSLYPLSIHCRVGANSDRSDMMPLRSCFSAEHPLIRFLSADGTRFCHTTLPDASPFVRCCSAPDFLGGLGDELELGLHFVPGEEITQRRRGEAALG